MGFPVKSYLWMWGLVYGMKGFGIIRDNDFLILSLGISLLYSILSIKLIHIAYRVKTYEDVYDSLNKFLYAIGIFQVILIIGLIVVLEIFYTGIWAVAEMGFGIIGILFSAFITIPLSNIKVIFLVNDKRKIIIENDVPIINPQFSLNRLSCLDNISSQISLNLSSMDVMIILHSCR